MAFPHNVLRTRLSLAAPFAALALLAGCATPTPYQPLGSRGQGGYVSQQIEDNRFRVAFLGNSLTSRERVENYLLYRAAELALEQGYDGFTIVNRDVERDVETRVRPIGIGPYPHWTPYWRWYGPRGWSYWHPWYGDPFFADTADVDTIERYEAIAEIVLYRGDRPAGVQSFDARQVIQNLRPTIELPR